MVLVVDDEVSVRKMLGDLIQLLGYEVHACSAGAEAIEFYQENHRSVEVSVIDLRLPDMDGMDVYDAFLAVSPVSKAIIISGCNTSQDVENMQANKNCRFLQKPFMLNVFKQTVDDLASQECIAG